MGYYVVMKKDNKVIFNVFFNYDLLQEWITDNVKLGYKLFKFVEHI